MPFLHHRPKITHCQAKEIASKKNGLRHAIFTVPGDRYKGEWNDNQKSGKGQMLTRSSRLYEGDWQRDFRHGFGVLALQRENKSFALNYRGDWKNGRMCGSGARLYDDGSYYVGSWKNSKRHGYGQMWYADGSFYDGDWKRDKRHGDGMFVLPDGNRYEGNWVEDSKHGRGRFFHLDTGQMQEGVWVENVCVYSTLVDIPYRQSAPKPTPHPIKSIKVVAVDDVCCKQEQKILEGQIKSCLSLALSINEEKSI